MLPKNNRLRQQEDFKSVFRGGKTYQGSSLSLRVRQVDRPFPRFGLIVSSAVAKKAIVRNRFRRQLSEIVGHHLGETNSGFDAILIAKPALVKKTFGEIKQEVISLFEKAKLFR